MKFVIIFWPQAVGKMTVGHELEKITDLKLFHNHMTIELVVPFFGFWSESPIGKQIVEKFRNTIFEEFSKTDQEWMIFTYIRAFNLKDDREYIENISNIFESKWADIYRVELEAHLDERAKRNTTPHRLKHKPSKKNIERSQNEIKETMKRFRMNSEKGEIKKKNYLKINNENLSAKKVANMIKEFIY